MVKIVPLTRTNDILQQASELHKNVWNNNDYAIKERIIKHSSYKGFRGLAMLSDEEQVIGFSYGYTSLPGQYYHELLAKEFHPEEYHYWFRDCFEVVELAVHASYRKQGVGTTLMTKLLENINHQTTILNTQSSNNIARTLYTSLHWKILKEPFYPESLKYPYVIMGKALK